MIKTYFNTELSAKCVQQRFTSSIFVAKVWKSPDISQTNNVSSYSQDELNLTAPLFSLFRFGLCMSGYAPKVHRINLSLLHFNLKQENKSVSVTYSKTWSCYWAVPFSILRQCKQLSRFLINIIRIHSAYYVLDKKGQWLYNTCHPQGVQFSSF